VADKQASRRSWCPNAAILGQKIDPARQVRQAAAPKFIEFQRSGALYAIDKFKGVARHVV
jgi:hypothetical protein